MLRPTQKMTVIDQIARELDQRYSFSEIDTYLGEFTISTPNEFDPHTKIEYVKLTLRGVETTTILAMAEDLEIAIPGANAAALRAPHNWPDDTKFRLSISHISEARDKATRLRDCLVPYYVSGFVAHQDIRPTAEWQIEIERALRTMDAFLAIHTKGFSKSFWTQQEIGFAVARGVKIISFKMDEDPTGFISKHQALPRLDRNAEDIAEEVNGLLLNDDLTAARMREVIAANWPRAEEITF
jgi:hypothetical protein